MTRAICTIDTREQYNGLQVVRIENDLVSVAILPQLGAKIWSFVHKPSATNLLWQNRRLAPAVVHYGAKFDDNWSGGWDELIPTDIPYAFPNGDVLPDHGEVWSQSSDWHVVCKTAESVTVTFVTQGRVLPTLFEKSSRCEQENLCYGCNTLTPTRGQGRFNSSGTSTRRSRSLRPRAWMFPPNVASWRPG